MQLCITHQPWKGLVPLMSGLLPLHCLSLKSIVEKVPQYVFISKSLSFLALEIFINASVNIKVHAILHCDLHQSFHDLYELLTPFVKSITSFGLAILKTLILEAPLVNAHIWTSCCTASVTDNTWALVTEYLTSLLSKENKEVSPTFKYHYLSLPVYYFYICILNWATAFWKRFFSDDTIYNYVSDQY